MRGPLSKKLSELLKALGRPSTNVSVLELSLQTQADLISANEILEYLEVKNVTVDPLGSTDANVGIEMGILSVNLGRTYGRLKHSLNEEADIDGLFLALKQVLFLLVCLN